MAPPWTRCRSNSRSIWVAQRPDGRAVACSGSAEQDRKNSKLRAHDPPASTGPPHALTHSRRTHPAITHQRGERGGGGSNLDCKCDCARGMYITICCMIPAWTATQACVLSAIMTGFQRCHSTGTPARVDLCARYTLACVAKGEQFPTRF